MRSVSCRPLVGRVTPCAPGLSKDRQKFIRPRDEFVRLGSRRFSKAETHGRHDLARIPYAALIMHCSK
jgi:hypothetical protein